MEKEKIIEQMGLFEMGEESPSPLPLRDENNIVPKSGSAHKTAPRAVARRPAAKLPQKKTKGSGLIPKGDVRLTANIREDLHLRLKISAARQRTTIGELIEELVESYL